MIGASGVELSLPCWRAERILYDADGLLVVDKPIHVPVYGGPEDLAHGLNERLGDYLQSLGRPRRLGVHQRLDQATSGVCLFTTEPARDAEVAAALENKTLRRDYVAVCHDPRGVLRQTGTLRRTLEKRAGRACVIRGASAESSAQKSAVTHYQVARRIGERALLHCQLETGRFHQIRASLADLGAPVLGDELYGGPAAARLYLHAVRLSGAPLPAPVVSPIPEQFEQVLSGRPLAIPEDALAVLHDAVVLRAPLLQVASAFRLANGEGDGLPGITIDYYGGYAVLNLYEAGWLPQRERLGQLLLELGCLGVYEKRRLRTDLRSVKQEQVAPPAAFLGESAPEELVVNEGEMQLVVCLSDGLSTGLFVDQRDNHQKTAHLCGGGEMLNLFCYTGAFSVMAARAGARTTSVDLSAKALNRTRRNFEQNELALEGHRFVKDDAMKFLARAARRGERYDFIVLDPPSFSTVGKGTFSVKGGYRQAAALCVELLGEGGKLLCVTNHVKTSPEQLRYMLRDVVGDSGRKLRYLKHLPSGLDCPPGPLGAFPSKSLLVEVT